MTVRKKISFFILLFITYSRAFTQDTIRLKNITKDPKSDRYKIFTDRPPQAVYIELGGYYGDLVATYDRRFFKKVDGFGFKLGVGKSIDYDNGVVLTPGINFLVGNNKRGRFLEVGVNQIFYTEPEKIYSYISSSGYVYVDRQRNHTQFFVGYRSQPTQGGFNFRGGLVPLSIGGYYTEPTVYLSLGYNF